MTTQNIEYSDEVKAFPLVASAFKLRDDNQLTVDSHQETIDSLNERLEEQYAGRKIAEENLKVADDKLALVATMAQDQIDAIEKVSISKTELQAERDDKAAMALEMLTGYLDARDYDEDLSKVASLLILAVDADDTCEDGG